MDQHNSYANDMSQNICAYIGYLFKVKFSLYFQEFMENRYLLKL